MRLLILAGLIAIAGYVANEALYPSPEPDNPLRCHVETCPRCQCPDAPVWGCVTGRFASDY